jgi:PAS domain S-box-containing protein
VNRQSPKATLDLLNALFHAMTDGVLVLDHEGRIIDCNPALYQRLGYEKHELIGLLIKSLEISKSTLKAPDWIAPTSPSDESTFETAYRRKDGSMMMAELNVRQIEVEDDILYMAIVHDITKRHQLKESVRESLEVYRAAINTPAMGFWAVDMEGRFVEVNDAYAKLSGYSRDELLSMSIMDIEAIEKTEMIHAHINKVMQTGFDRFRSKHIRKDGTLWPVEVVASYSNIQGGRFFVFIDDITEKVAQENHLKLASRVFETIEQAVVITDAANRIVSINPAFTRITGFCLSEVLGKIRGYSPQADTTKPSMRPCGTR